MHKKILFFRAVAFAVLSAVCTRAEQQDTANADKDHFSFAVTADPRADHASWMNALCEIRDMKNDETPHFVTPSWILIAGDFDPARQRMEDVHDVFACRTLRPQVLPVVGNHDLKAENAAFIRQDMLAAVPGLIKRQADACDYYYDFKNVRLIVVDLYDGLGHNGDINKKGRQWVEGVICSAPASIDHIFIAFHEPAFPRGKHLEDSMNENRHQRDAFWQMLVAHRDKVRAAFVGHTHCYSRMRVRDPKGAAANNASVFPDEPDGIYQIDAGATGHAASNTFVRVQIDGKQVSARAYAAQNGTNQAFTVIDRWQF